MADIKSITEAHFILKDTTSAGNIPAIYEKGTKELRAKIDGWSIFKCVNYIIKESVNNKDLLKLYKPTDVVAKNGSKDKIALLPVEYNKLIGND